MQFDTSGNVSVGYTDNTTMTNKFTVNGTVKCTTLYQMSDRNLKKDIQPLGQTLKGGDHLALNYNDLSVAGIKALQELKQEKDAEIQLLKTRVAALEKLITKMAEK